MNDIAYLLLSQSHSIVQYFCLTGKFERFGKRGGAKELWGTNEMILCTMTLEKKVQGIFFVLHTGLQNDVLPCLVRLDTSNGLSTSNSSVVNRRLLLGRLALDHEAALVVLGRDTGDGLDLEVLKVVKSAILLKQTRRNRRL